MRLVHYSRDRAFVPRPDAGHEVVEVFVPAGQLPLLELVGRETTVRLPWDAVFAACRAANEEWGES